jgi:hypothetical protein
MNAKIASGSGRAASRSAPEIADLLAVQSCGATTPESQFSTTKWLRLRDALALSCRRLDRKNAKQEICDSVIAQRILLRGVIKGHYEFFSYESACAYLMPSNIDWRAGRLYSFHEQYRAPSDLCILNDEAFRAFVDGHPLRGPKTTGSIDTKPRRCARGGRPEKFLWDDIWIEACRYIHEDGVPATPAELMRHLQQWCELQFGEQPADSTLKSKLRKLYAALRRPDEN